jgi:hypothetical protein
MVLQDDIPLLTQAAKAERAEREARYAAMKDGRAAEDGIVLYMQVGHVVLPMFVVLPLELCSAALRGSRGSTAMPLGNN